LAQVFFGGIVFDSCLTFR